MGGLLGLFMGFSVFSIVEIFYFLTFRPCIHHMKVPKKHRQRHSMKGIAKRLYINRGRNINSHIRFERPENVFPYVN